MPISALVERRAIEPEALQDLKSVFHDPSIDKEAWLDSLQHYEDAFCHVVTSPTAIGKVTGCSR